MFASCFFASVSQKSIFLNKVTFPIIIVYILHFIQPACSFKVEPVRIMSIIIIVLLDGIIKIVLP